MNECSSCAKWGVARVELLAVCRLQDVAAMVVGTIPGNQLHKRDDAKRDHCALQFVHRRPRSAERLAQAGSVARLNNYDFRR